jgi:NADH-quinone oxidoreductase subunit J
MATVVFWCFAVAAIVCALCCITQRSPIAAALWLVGTMFNLAGLYVLMHAQFVAAVQVLVYAGAVMVLFLFVIMLLNLGRTSSDFRGRPAVLGSVALAVVLIAELLVLRRTQAAGMSPDMLAGIREPSTNVIGQVAEPMFRHWLIPFEVTSILLLAAIVGSVILAKRKV